MKAAAMLLNEELRMRNLRFFAASTSGATAIEYAMIAGFVSIVIFTAADQIGGKVLVMFQSMAAGFH
jgi:Flp pilus assembly pilin Flp